MLFCELVHANQIYKYHAIIASNGGIGIPAPELIYLDEKADKIIISTFLGQNLTLRRQVAGYRELKAKTIHDLNEAILFCDSTELHDFYYFIENAQACVCENGHSVYIAKHTFKGYFEYEDTDYIISIIKKFNRIEVTVVNSMLKTNFIKIVYLEGNDS